MQSVAFIYIHWFEFITQCNSFVLHVADNVIAPVLHLSAWTNCCCISFWKKFWFYFWQQNAALRDRHTHTISPHPTQMKTNVCIVPQKPLALCTKHIWTFRKTISIFYLAFSTLFNANSTFKQIFVMHFYSLYHCLMHFFNTFSNFGRPFPTLLAECILYDFFSTFNSLFHTCTTFNPSFW